MSKRQYTLRHRAAKQAQTRARIVDAIMALHEEVGPRNTTVRAIANRAGVERLTVYRHFPDEASLFQACSARFLELNPPPDPTQWQQETSACARSRQALFSLYRYYRGTCRMFVQVYRDANDIPALRATVDEFQDYLAGLHQDLTARWSAEGVSEAEARPVLGHALSFSTWHSLQSQGLPDERTAELMVLWLLALPRRG